MSNNNKDEVLVYLHIEGLPENDPLPSKMGKEYFDKNVEAVTREILERVKESNSTYKDNAQALLELMDDSESGWEAQAIYKAKIPSTGKVTKVSRTTPLRKFVAVERILNQETNTSHLYLKPPIDGGYQSYSLKL